MLSGGKRSLLTCAALLAALTGCGPSGPEVAVIGDSYVDGSTRDSGTQWHEMIAEERGWAVKDFASGGSGYVAAGSDDKVFGDRVAAVIEEDPAAVVVSGGFNDPLGSAFETAVASTLKRLREGLPETPISVLSVFDPEGQPDVTTEKNAVIQAAAEHIDATYVDVSDVFDGHPELIGGDGVHPNDAGHEAIAATVSLLLPTPATESR